MMIYSQFLPTHRFKTDFSRACTDSQGRKLKMDSKKEKKNEEEKDLL